MLFGIYVITAETTAISMLDMTPGILDSGLVESFLVQNALFQQEETKVLIKLLEKKMVSNPNILASPDEEVEAAMRMH